MDDTEPQTAAAKVLWHHPEDARPADGVTVEGARC
jgi:hypothetical protein